MTAPAGQPGRAGGTVPAGLGTVSAIILDGTDLDRLSAFWTEVLGMRVTAREEQWVDLEPVTPGGPVLSLQRVPERTIVKNRVHLDVEVPDLDVARYRIRRLGGRTRSPAFPPAERPWQVFADPDGNEFCALTAPPG